MYNVFLRLIYKKQKRKHVYTFKVIFSIVFLVETLKPRWKTNWMVLPAAWKKLKTIKGQAQETQKSQYVNFSKNSNFWVKNKPTNSNVNIANNSGSSLDGIPSPPHTPIPSTSSIPNTNLGHWLSKRKLTRLSHN